MWVLCAMLLTLLSSMGLFFSWKYPSHPYQEKYTYFACLGLFLALLCWIKAIGTEYALIYCWLIFACIVLLIILHNQERRPYQRKPIGHQSLSFPTMAISLKQLGLFFLIIPMSGWVSLSGVIVLAGYLPWLPENRIVFSMLIIPIVWALLVYRLCFKRCLWGDCLRLSLIASLTTFIIYV